MPSASITPSTREIPEGKVDFDDSKISSTELGSTALAQGIGSARTPWYGTSAILVSEIMGTGMLGLPFVAITLGWGVTMVAMPLFAVFAAYAGYQLQTVKLAHPEVGSFADAGELLVGPRFGAFTKFCMLLNWGSLAIYMLIATADGIANISSSGWLGCNFNRTIIAAIILLLPAQTRDFHTISKYLSMPSTIAILVALIIIIVALVDDAEEDAGTTFPNDTTIVGVEEGTSVFDFLQSLSSIVFAYQGQSIFMELMTEMKKPKEFTKSLNIAYLLMVFVYASTVIIAYGLEGDSVESFLPNTVPMGKAKITIGVLVVFHIMVAYVLAIQPFHMWMHQMIFPKTYNVPTVQGRLHWLLLTVGYIFFAWIIVNLVPFFGDLQALIGATLGAPIVFGWPSLYYLLVCKENANAEKKSSSKDDESSASWCDALFSSTRRSIHSAISLLFLCVITPLFLVLGTWGGVTAIIEDIGSSGRPFHC